MKISRHLPIFRPLMAFCLCLAGVSHVHAQEALLLTLDNGYRNPVHAPVPVVPPGGSPEIPVVGAPEFEAYQVQRKDFTLFGGYRSGGFGSLGTGPVPLGGATSPDFPKSSPSPGAPLSVELRSVVIGRPLAVFKINYNFGSVISPPVKLVGGVEVDEFYRGEPLNARIKTTVVVNDADGSEVSRVIEDATAADFDGVTKTLAGGQTTTVTIGLNPQFYWSKHAQLVYATQPGNITVKWRETATVEFIEETYTISSGPDQPERTLYWTDNGHKGPPVNVPDGRVNKVNIIYNTLVPKEVVTPDAPWLDGLVDFAETDPAKKRYKTFYYANNLIHAYNVQGRVFVEYLGNPRPDGTNEQKGIDIVNIVKDAVPIVSSVDLGDELTQDPLEDEEGNPAILEPRVIAGLGLTGDPYVHQQVAPNGDIDLYAIRETQVNTPNAVKVLDNNVLVYWLETAKLGLKWPKQYIGYIQEWPDDPAAYSIYARPDADADPDAVQATAVQLDAADNPALVYQDDPEELQAVKTPENKFYTEVTQGDPTNRALLRFSKDADVWFERVYSQLDPYLVNPAAYLDDAPLVERTVTGSTDPLGDFVTGHSNISNVRVVNSGTGEILIEGVDYTLDPITGVIRLIGNPELTTVQITFSVRTLPFSGIPAVVEVEVGARIEPDLDLVQASPYGDDSPVFVGYIYLGSGTAYSVDAYKDPFVEGFEAAAKGSIIGINALEGKNELEVWWYRKSTPRGSKINGTLWPSFVQKYQLKWPDQSSPTPPDRIVLASNKGSDDLPGSQAQGSIYYKNLPDEPGYNPNEEHALMQAGRVWALRDDLNVPASSEPYVLLQYTDADQRPAMRVFEVMREDESDTFDYEAEAGKLLQAPMPLTLLPAPLLPDRSLASYEVPGVADSSVNADFENSDSAFIHYQKFTWADRKGGVWIYRGPHQDVAPAPSLKMRYFYATLPGFDFPSEGADQPRVGTITPYLRPGSPGSYIGDPVTGFVDGAAGRAEQPLDITFRPRWPDSAPELRMGETLTLPKVGLPQVRGQQSAEIIYQQSIARDTTGTEGMAARKKSARLFDPTRAKVYPLGGPASPAEEQNNLSTIPGSVNTSLYLGKTYFPNLPPHLSSRLYFDPAVGKYGSLVFKGVFMDELFGEKYLHLNVLNAADLKSAKELVSEGSDKKDKWDLAIDGLETTMETFVEDPGKLGTYKVLNVESDTLHRPYPDFEGEEVRVDEKNKPLIATEGEFKRPAVGPGDLAEIYYSDTAVDSYAVSASGGGSGFIVLAVGNGENSDVTSKDGPVSLEVFKVKAPLYRGELKVVNSANPLDEKLTLQHTGDFAGKPEEYDFEWRYAAPVDGLPLKLYSFARTLIVNGNNDDWQQLHNPENDYEKYRVPATNDGDLNPVTPQQGIVINNGEGTAAHGSLLPYALIRKTFSATKRPLRLFLSLEMGDNDGAVVYLNGARVASWKSPLYESDATTDVPATAPAFSPLPLVFEINANALNEDGAGDNNVFTVELYTSADAGSSTTFNLRLEGSQEVENLAGWLPLIDAKNDTVSDDSKRNNAASPKTKGIVAVAGKNRHTIQGASILTLSDNYVIMRYRAKEDTNVAYQAEAGWSKWTEPQLAEGWIKRVLAGINPFQQRIKDLFNHETNTSVSLVEQAGKRWEGNIALNLENINDSGLVEIYETVLNRGKDLSISGNPAINYGGANDALLLAAGYLSDLYMILGNEAYADAANPTIAFSTQSAANFISEYGDVATSLFSFKGQLATVLEEELALLRGRDDFLLPGIQTAPVYNRLVWNYTRGIDSGEAIYALNYNIKDRVWDYSLNSSNPGALPADGIISAADAATSYPQGHGDAYGHYLTALTGYYNLLNNENFTWTPRIEAVLVLGKPVSVDYQDERKFAAAAVALARTASQTLDLTYRQQYNASEDPGWSHLQDGKANTNTGRTRNWGTDDWATRGGQGALFHWVTANSLLPSVDPDPTHSGIQKIDRTTVPELAEIAAQAAVIQQTLDHADSNTNPLGLGAGALTFDISPSEVDAGKTHYDQIFERATVALQNAVSAFDNAKGSTQFLRQQEDTLEGQRNAIKAQEQAYTNELIELYGTPYTDDIGPGRTYKQDYAGPDLLHYQIVDQDEIFGIPSNGDDPAGEDPSTYKEYDLPIAPTFVNGNTSILNPISTVKYLFNPEGQVVKDPSWSGRRVSPGRMQTMVSDLLLARQDLETALDRYKNWESQLDRQIELYESAVATKDSIGDVNNETSATVLALGLSKVAASAAKAYGEVAEQALLDASESVIDSLPVSVGLSNDPSFAARGLARTATTLTSLASNTAQAGLAILVETLDDAQEAILFTSEARISSLEFGFANKQLLYDLQSAIAEFPFSAGDVDVAIRQVDQAKRDLYALQAKGDRIQLQRLVFRQHTAAIIQGYRTRDFAFRAFRDEALERYKALFDLSARYTYLAASAYDYETGLLDATGNASAADFYEKIVQARSLGVVSDGEPQFAGASTGDPGLSGVLAELAGDWSVAKTRLGFNNPDNYATTFSLREENFRLVPGKDGDLPWRDQLSEFKMGNILEDPDVRRHCMQIDDPNGGAVPGIVIPFSTTIATGYNFFGRPLAGGDHTFTPSSFSTKIRSSGIALPGYVGMDSPTTTSGTLGDIGATSPDDPNTGFGGEDSLSATPYIYLIPAGADSMRSPPLGDTSFVRTWAVQDQAIPLPFNIADSDYSTQPAWVSAASLSEAPFTLRKHQAFRAVPDGTNFQGGYGFTNARLIGRSAWNSQWKIVIPGNTLLSDPNLGINTFISTVKDIKLHLETYSYSGN